MRYQVEGQDDKIKGCPVHERVWHFHLLDRCGPWTVHDVLPIGLFLFLTVLVFWEPLSSDKMLFGTDSLAGGLFIRSFLADFGATHHEFPFWQPYIFGGMPFVDGMHGDIFYPTTVLKFLLPVHLSMGYKLILHVFLAGVFMYACARTLHLRRITSFFAAVVYMFSSSFVSLVYAGHDGKIFVIALFPLAFALLEKGLASGKVLSFIGLGGMLGLMILTPHIQMVYYSLWVLGFYFLFKVYLLWPRSAVRYVSYFTLSILLGLTLSAIQLLPSYMYATHDSPRAQGGMGYDYATSWSLHPEELVALLVPDFVGTDIGGVRKYWGRNPFKLNSEYLGMIPVLLAFFNITFLKDKMVWFFWGVFALAIINALGSTTPIYKLICYCVPGVNMFRAPSMSVFLAAFAVTILASSSFRISVFRSLREKRG